MSTILYIDGENLKHYLKSVLKQAGIKEDKLNLENFAYSALFDKVLKGITITEKRYYSAKIRFHEDNAQKSKELITKQRVQKTNLEKNGIKVIIGGNVRPQEITLNGKKKTIFHEKGVDVKIAVDLVANACDKTISSAILCSSDSDLQPAVKEARARGVEIVYLGFENSPNKGLSYTTHRTILIRNSEVLETFNK
ncbi:MAG: NYN domain-containing protein [bacterium]